MLNTIKNAPKSVRITIALAAATIFLSLVSLVFVAAINLAVMFGEYVTTLVTLEPAIWMLTGIIATVAYGLIAILSNCGDGTKEKAIVILTGIVTIACVFGCMYSQGFAAYSATTLVTLPLFIMAIAKGLNPFKVT